MKKSQMITFESARRKVARKLANLARNTSIKERHEAAKTEVRELIQESNSNYKLNSSKLKAQLEEVEFIYNNSRTRVFVFCSFSSSI